MSVVASIHGNKIMQPVPVTGNEPLQPGRHVLLQLRLALIHIHAGGRVRRGDCEKAVPNAGRFQPVSNFLRNVEDLDRVHGLELDPRSKDFHGS